MKNRNKIIAIFFVVFILVIPAVTFVRGFTKQDDNTELTQEQKELLEENGGIHENLNNNTEDTSIEEIEDSNVFDAFARHFTDLKNDLSQFTNRLFLKTKFIAFNTQITSFLTNGMYLESNTALLGREGWVFYKAHSDGQPIWNYMGINNFTEEELARGAANLIETRDALAQRGIGFVAMCLPNKETIYSEYMPDTVVQVNEVTKGQQFADYMWANTDINYLYPKNVLLEAKKDNVIYYKTDTHWNQIGAFIGFNEFLKAYYGKGEDVSKLEFDFAPNAYVGDIIRNAEIADRYPADDVYRFVSDSADQSLFHDEKVLIVGDSFSAFFIHYAPSYFKDFQRVEIQNFTWDVIDEYKPDVVLWETVERYNTNYVDKGLTQR